YPSSAMRCSKATQCGADRWAPATVPTLSTFASCPRTASGHATIPVPRTVTNSRRLTGPSPDDGVRISVLGRSAGTNAALQRLHRAEGRFGSSTVLAATSGTRQLTLRFRMEPLQRRRLSARAKPVTRRAQHLQVGPVAV